MQLVYETLLDWSRKGQSSSTVVVVIVMCMNWSYSISDALCILYMHLL